jgi:formylglycine-generating enzyme required for sulfatase activity
MLRDWRSVGSALNIDSHLCQNIAMSESQQTVRVFISSPGDVVDERDKARRVIEGLQRKYPGVTLQPVLWEELALPATASFQETIDVLLERQPIDVAVFILWSRLGSPLGAAVTRQDGSPYRSGTEREFDMMLAAFEQSGRQRPVILAYARDDDAGFKRKLTESPRSKLQELIEQRELADAFIREQFQDAEGHNLRALQSYREPVGFAQRLRVHLRHALDGLLGADAAPRWLDDPYRGLQAFDLEHATIFHGRDEETCELLQRLRDQQQAGCEFVVIVGASGSGKSSLARAGVAANLVEHVGDDDVNRWRMATVIPGIRQTRQDESEDRCDDLCSLLTRTLAKVLPELGNSGTALDDIAAGLAKDPALTVRLSISPAFARASTSGAFRILLVLDQMEELWTDRRITAKDREQFLLAVEALARSGQVAVLGTLRADFYPHAQQMETFLRLKGERGHFDLLPPGPAALARLITEPARLAGVRFEQDEHTGRSLDEVILQDAARDPAALPLLQYTLDELFRHRDEGNRQLTFARYEELGGVEGSLGKRAEDIFGSLPADAQAALTDILPLLVTVDTTGDQSAVRRRVSLVELTSNLSRRTLTEALTTARFLTTDRQDESPIASLAHEALLRRWGRIANWITANRDHLRLRARLEHNQQLWEQQSRDESLLLPVGLPLEEARQLLTDASHLLTSATDDYVYRSLDHHTRQDRRTRRRRQSVMTLLSILTLAASVGGIFAWQKQREADAERGIAVVAQQRADSALENQLQAERERRQAEQESLQKEVQSAVTAMSTARSILVPYTISTLTKLPQKIVLPELQRQFDQADVVQRLSLSYALAALNDVRVDFLVSQVESVSPVEVANLVTALRSLKKESISALEAAIESAAGGQHWGYQARLAILALHLDAPTSAGEMCQLRADPIRRTVFIEEIRTWCVVLDGLAEVATGIADSPLRSALLLGVGSIPGTEVVPAAKDAWLSLAKSWYTSEPDTLTHSSAAWLLRAWDVEAPAIASSEGPADGQNWYVNSVGMTLLQIPSGRFVRKASKSLGDSRAQTARTVTLSRRFFLQAMEVTRGQFQQFMDDPDCPAEQKPQTWPGVDQEISPDDEHPVQWVNWDDAVLFCNWLSGREDRQPCYERIANTEKTPADWESVSAANGYRLPPEAVWEYACRAGTTTDFSHGDSEELLARYCVFREEKSARCGTKLPNGWGLHDMHGNVSEWCQDRQRSHGSSRVYRGGCWRFSSQGARSAFRFWGSPGSRLSFLGFRVLRSSIK